ncbi:hypothetical protein HanIR_Chr06g0262271 [Helianthus annuus]|nr:hypothetical protein HanIR_Chr06g0262271 [Helianthus annuus]
MYNPFIKKCFLTDRPDPTRPNPKPVLTLDPFQPEPVLTRTKTTLFLIDPF